jgi:hypothetical protein
VLCVGAALALGVGLQGGASGADTVTWSAVTPSAPGGGVSYLGGVTCPAAGSCVAVGETSGSGALVESLTGTDWTPTELNQGLTYPQLNGVWCASMTSCIAVGAYGSLPSPTNGLIETLANGTWTADTSVPVPVGATSAELSAISCITITSCWAAGSYTDSGGTDTHALFESLSGGTWSIATSTDPPTSGRILIDSLQCFSATSCMAVGGWGPTAGDNGLLETLSGSTWTASTIQSGMYLQSLWCTSSTSCIAAGDTSTSGSVTETLSGTTWTETALPGLGDGGSDNGVAGISCTDITSCVIIGSWRPPAPNSSEPLLLLRRLSGGVWTPTELSAPGGLLYPEGIACPTITSCVGVGQSEGAPPVVADTVLESAVVQTPPPPSPPPPAHGYWLVGSDGGIFTFGSAQFYGSTGSLHLQRPVVGIVPTADRGGYWLDASDGGVFAYGDTQYYGSIPGVGLHPAGSGLPNSLDAPIVGMVPSIDDDGYFMVASDGGVFAFGDAHFAGSCPGIGGCSGSAVAVMPDRSGNGYWLVTSTGNIYTFGDAPYFGAPGHGNVTAAVATPDGRGYWVLLSDGEIFAYGDAAGAGAPGSANFNAFDPASAIFATSDGAGYWVASAGGTVFNFGDAPNDGDMAGTHLNGSIIAASGF